MDYFLLIPAAIIFYSAVMIMRKPDSWLTYLNLVPTTIFLAYARLHGMNNQAWRGAFELAALLSVCIIVILWNQKATFNRIMLGLNCYFIVGGCGFLFNIEPILQWYSVSKGGPLFGSLLIIGFITTIFTKKGFVGIAHKNKEAVRYASFLLLAATFIALVWSVKSDSEGLLWAVVIPFIGLRIVRRQLIDHLF